MCRLLIVAGERSALPRLYPLIDAFAESARRDPYLAAITGGEVGSHDDGWGYIALGPSNRTVYKSLRPVFEDVRGRQYLKEVLDDEWFLAVIHARKAAPGQPVSLENVHPMCVHSSAHGVVCVAHNGTVYKDKIASLLGLEDMLERLNDTFFLAKFLAKSQDIGRAVEGLIASGFVKTAINLGILVPDERRMGVAVYNVFGHSVEEREKYYRFYRLEAPGLLVYSSSTLVDYYMSPSDMELSVVPLGSYVEISRQEHGFTEKSRVMPEASRHLGGEEPKEL